MIYPVVIKTRREFLAHCKKWHRWFASAGPTVGWIGRLTAAERRAYGRAMQVLFDRFWTTRFTQRSPDLTARERKAFDVVCMWTPGAACRASEGRLFC